MSEATQRQHRCCATHASYDELTEHLIVDFAEIDKTDVAREVARAVAAVRLIGLDRTDDQLLMCELVARQQLQLLAGRTADVARLDPQPHPGRARHTMFATG